MTARHPHGDTNPAERCSVCGKPSEWEAEFYEYDRLRNPPYNFMSVPYCDACLPDESRERIPRWALSAILPHVS